MADLGIQHFLSDLVDVATFLSGSREPVLTVVIPHRGVEAAALPGLAVDPAEHGGPALRAADKPRKDMYVLRSVARRMVVRVLAAFPAYRLPCLVRDERVVLALEQVIPVPQDAVELVPGALDFLALTPPISDHAGIDRVVQHGLYERRGDTAVQIGLASVLCIAVCVEPLGDARVAQVGVGELVEDHADQLGFGFLDGEGPVFDLVAIRGRSAVPGSLAGLLDTPGHGLGLDVLAFDLGHGSEDRNHQLARRARAVDTVIDREQVDAVVLHELQIVQHVGGVASEPGQLEHQDVGYAVRVAVLDAVHHLCELRTARGVLAGLALVGELGGHGHLPVLRFFDEPVALGVQRVAVHLHLGGYAGVEIALLLLFGTGHYFFLPSVRIGLISGCECYVTQAVPINRGVLGIQVHDHVPAIQQDADAVRINGDFPYFIVDAEAAGFIAAARGSDGYTGSVAGVLPCVG